MPLQVGTTPVVNTFRTTSEIGLLALLLVSAWLLGTGAMGVEAAAATCVAVFLMLVFFPVRNTEIFSPITLLAFSYFVFLLLGALVFEVIRERDYLPEAQLLVFSGFIYLSLGLLIGNFLFSFKPRHEAYTLYCREPKLIWALLGVSMLAYVTLIAMGGIPLLSENPNHARIQFFSGKGHFAVFVRAAPVLSIALLIDAIGRGSRNRLLRSHIVFAIVIVMNLLTGARGATLSVVLVYMLVYLSLTGTRVTKLQVFLAALAALVMLSVVGAQRRFSEISFDNLFQELVVILSARPAAVQRILDRFPEGQEFGLINYFSDIVRLLPGVDVSQNARVRDIIFSSSTDMHQLAGINPSLVGEAMMNVGPLGPYFLPFAVGLFAAGIYALAKSGKPTFFSIAIYFSVMAELVISVSSGLGTRMPGLIIAIFWIVVVSRLFTRQNYTG